MCWHLPIFPDRHQSSIFGTTELNFRVRHGNGWTLSVINTNSLFCFLLSFSRLLDYYITLFQKMQVFFLKNFKKSQIFFEIFKKASIYAVLECLRFLIFSEFLYSRQYIAVKTQNHSTFPRFKYPPIN